MPAKKKAAKKKTSKKKAASRKKSATREQQGGKGTKPERKEARRDAAEAGRGPNRPRRTDRAMPGEGKRRQGPRSHG